MNKIQAIKTVRERTNLGLKESKDLVEEIAPLLQMNREDIDNRLLVIDETLNRFKHDVPFTTMSAKRLLELCEERDRLKALAGITW